VVFDAGPNNNNVLAGLAMLGFPEFNAIGENAVPIPGALLMFGSGLAGLFGWRVCQR
jgi:hypothetical protein